MLNTKLLLATGILVTMTAAVADEKPVVPSPEAPAAQTAPMPPAPAAPPSPVTPAPAPIAAPTLPAPEPVAVNPAAPKADIATPKPVAGEKITNPYYAFTLPNEYTRDMETEHAYMAELGPDAKDVDAKAFTRISLDDSLLVVTLPVEKNDISNVEYWSKIINAGQEAAFSENKMKVVKKVTGNGTANGNNYQRTTYSLETHGINVVNISYVFAQASRVYLIQFTLPSTANDAADSIKFADSIVNNFKITAAASSTPAPSPAPVVAPAAPTAPVNPAAPAPAQLPAPVPTPAPVAAPSPAPVAPTAPAMPESMAVPPPPAAPVEAPGVAVPPVPPKK